MSKRYMKVLSIDFDYFQDVTPEVLTACYPDGKDLPTYITMVTWANHYASDHDKIMSVKIDQKHFDEINEIIRNQNIDTPNMVVQSHKHICQFIKDNFDPTVFKGCRIVNIDMHHDCFNNSSELDCGNWVEHIIKDIPNCQVSWIANKVSQEVYGFNDALSEIVSYDFDKIRNTKFDLIFICRSDTWLPPHLDPYFHELFETIQSTFYRSWLDDQITEPRNFDDIMKLADQLNIQKEDFMKNRSEEKNMKKRTVDKTKKSNIKCEHCAFWDFHHSNSEDGLCHNSKSAHNNTKRKYYNRCTAFEWPKE